MASSKNFNTAVSPPPMGRYKTWTNTLPPFDTGSSHVLISGIEVGMDYEWKSSSVTPHFFEMSRRGKLLPCNPYTRGEELIRRHVGSYSWTSGSYNYTQTGNCFDLGSIGAPWLKSSSDVAAAKQKLTLKLLSKCKEQNIDLSMIIAERQQTIDLFSSTMIRVAKMYDTLSTKNVAQYVGKKIAAGLEKKYTRKRPRSKKVRDSMKQAANDWLAFQYGVIPLVNDCFGALVELDRKEYEYKRISASSKIEMTLEDSGSTGTVKYTRNIREVTKYRGTLLYKHVPSTNIPMTALGFTNPAKTLYELVPYSFVLDWFIPVGEWIGSWDATVGLEFCYGSLAEKLEYKADIQFSGAFGVTGNGSASDTAKTYVREKMLGFPSLSLPVVKDAYSTLHLANALALLVGAVSKGSKNIS